MPAGTTLAALRGMLNAEAGEETDESISPARVGLNNALLNNQQLFLANQHAYLRGKTRVELAAITGQQYYDLPAGIDFDRLEKPEFTNVSHFRYRLGFGIGQEEYNVFRSDLGEQSSPVMRWDLVNHQGALKIELWPIPSTAQTLMLAGLLPVTPMVDDTDVCVLDDLALVLFTAAEVLLQKNSPLAQLKAEKAKAYLDNLKASYPIKHERFNLAGQPWHLRDRDAGNHRRPVVAVG